MMLCFPCCAQHSLDGPYLCIATNQLSFHTPEVSEISILAKQTQRNHGLCLFCLSIRPQYLDHCLAHNRSLKKNVS